MQSITTNLSLGLCDTYSNFLEEMTIFGEYLHAGALVAAVADHELAGGAHHSHLPGIPQLPLLFASHAEVELVIARFIKHLRTPKLL